MALYTAGLSVKSALTSSEHDRSSDASGCVSDCSEDGLKSIKHEAISDTAAAAAAAAVSSSSDSSSGRLNGSCDSPKPLVAAAAAAPVGTVPAAASAAAGAFAAAAATTTGSASCAAVVSVSAALQELQRLRTFKQCVQQCLTSSETAEQQLETLQFVATAATQAAPLVATAAATAAAAAVTQHGGAALTEAAAAELKQLQQMRKFVLQALHSSTDAVSTVTRIAFVVPA
jgi:hypothetical protein